MSRKGHNKGQRLIRVLKSWKKGKKREVLQITNEFTELLWHARRDSNPQLSEPESDALSIELRTHNHWTHSIVAENRSVVKNKLSTGGGNYRLVIRVLTGGRFWCYNLLR